MYYSKHFLSAYDVTTWLNSDEAADITIVSVVSDAASGGFTVFYKGA